MWCVVRLVRAIVKVWGASRDVLTIYFSLGVVRDVVPPIILYREFLKIMAAPRYVFSLPLYT